ncbi:MAG: peptidyl-prolyl cis-trans isomerase [Deltaproteobacteria bacterium]|nr:peptidyl-prolyl cis-trans isomerase [Deltaproteobacteria bacterium]
MSDHWFRRLLREPLLHFVILGATVFGVSRLTQSTDDDVIIIDAAVEARIDAELEQALGRPPTTAEHEQGLARWADGERLFREGLALGLDQGDPMVRKRVLQKMEFVATNLELPPDPDDATLEQFMGSHPERYAGTPRFDFVMVTVPRLPEDTDDARAQVVLRQLQAGTDPKDVEGRKSSGKRFSAANTAKTYGPHIAEALEGATVGEWIEVPFDRGWSLLRLDSTQLGETRPLSEMRNRVLLDWKAAQRADAIERRLVQLRTQYPTRRVP